MAEMICRYRGCGGETSVTMIWRERERVEVCPPCRDAILGNQMWLVRNATTPERSAAAGRAWRARRMS